MVEYNQNHERGLDLTLSSLADPTRRAILASLRAGERRVTEIAEPFDMSLNAVSKHVKTLEKAELVIRRKAGREHFLSANPTVLAKTAQWFDAQRAFWAARLDTLEDLIKEEINNE